IDWLGKVKDSAPGKGILSAVGGGLSVIPGLAGGGEAKAGKVHVVGEYGPELFIPRVSGTVIPHDESVAMASAGSGSVGSIVININAQGASEDAASAIGAAAEAGVLSALAQYTSAR